MRKEESHVSRKNQTPKLVFMEQGNDGETNKLAKPLRVIIVKFSFMKEICCNNAQPFKCVMHGDNITALVADCTVRTSTYFLRADTKKIC